jgi:Spy/CpxP family protein refolding chaperone
MKKMIRMGMMVAAMFVAVSTVAKAQDAQQQGGRRGGGGGAGRITAVLKDSMHVSDAIVAKADSIQKAYAAQQAPLMEAMRGGDADARTKMMDLRNKQTADIKALLTDEQKAQFDKIMAAFPQGRRGGN